MAIEAMLPSLEHVIQTAEQGLGVQPLQETGSEHVTEDNPHHVPSVDCDTPEEVNESNSFDLVVKLPITKPVTWKEAEALANAEGGGLPTCEDFEANEVSTGDGVNLWMPVQRSDALEGDYCQVGNHPGLCKQRYISHIDVFGVPRWGFNNTDALGQRPTTFIYAKKKPDLQDKMSTQIPQGKAFIIDLCFLLDGTGSMESWIRMCEEKISEIADGIRLKIQHNNITLRLACVTFRVSLFVRMCAGESACCKRSVR